MLNVTQLVYDGARAGTRTVQLCDPHCQPHPALYLPRPREESDMEVIMTSRCSPHLIKNTGVSRPPQSMGDTAGAEAEWPMPHVPQIPRPPGQASALLGCHLPPSASSAPEACSVAAPGHWACWAPAPPPEGRPSGLSPQLWLLTSGGPRMRLHAQDPGFTGSSSQESFHCLSRQKNPLRRKRRTPPSQSWPLGESPCSVAGLCPGSMPTPTCPPPFVSIFSCLFIPARPHGG